MRIMDFILVWAALLILAVGHYVQGEQMDELRKDVNRVSNIQARCLGTVNETQCMDDYLHHIER